MAALLPKTPIAKVPDDTEVVPEYVLAPESVHVPEPSLAILKTVGPSLEALLTIVPVKLPVPLSLPTESVSALPPPPEAKSIVPLPVIVPDLMVAPAAP